MNFGLGEGTEKWIKIGVLAIAALIVAAWVRASIGAGGSQDANELLENLEEFEREEERIQNSN